MTAGEDVGATAQVVAAAAAVGWSSDEDSWEPDWRSYAAGKHFGRADVECTRVETLDQCAAA